ncbi:MAG: PaaI family thioesterase [Pseudomonadota bacterium]
MSETEAAAKPGIDFDPSEFAPNLVSFVSMLTEPGAPNIPVGIKSLGIRPDLWLKKIKPGHVTYVWPNQGERDISPGRAFGGWVAGFSDHIVSICMFSALKEGEAFTTQDLQVKLFRPVGHGDVTITAEVKNRSRTTGYVEAEWRNADGKLAAKVLAWKAIRPEAELRPTGR